MTTASENQRGSGNGRSRRMSRTLSMLSLAAVLAGPTASRAQLEVLLRGLDAATPRPGTCGRYQFDAEEPTGKRRIVFEACVDHIEPGPDGSVVLRFTSGDSLDARVEVAPALFRGLGGSLVDHVRGIVEISGRDTTRLRSEDWTSLPGLDRTPPLAGARDSLLGARDLEVGKRVFRSQGRRVHEESRQVKPLGKATMTQTAVRDVETWTNPEAPILGLVRAEATLRAERTLSASVPGVPQTAPRRWFYRLQLLEVLRPRGGRARRGF